MGCYWGGMGKIHPYTGMVLYNHHNHDNYYVYNIMNWDPKILFEVFKFAPAIVALFAVIYLQYRIIMKKDQTIEKLVNSSQADIERQAKMITLMEILVNRAQQGGGS
jgi:hypothetical protein